MMPGGKNNVIQVKLTLDPEMLTAWNTLKNEYNTLDKSAIIRLAIGKLAKSVKKSKALEKISLIKDIEVKYGKDQEITDEEFEKFWNQYKHELKS